MVYWDLPLSEIGMDSEMFENLNNLKTPFWLKCRMFIQDIDGRKFSSLTKPQQEYAHTIIAFLRVDTNRKISIALSKGEQIEDWHELLRYHTPGYHRKFL
jgi:hypothetical protein